MPASFQLLKIAGSGLECIEDGRRTAKVCITVDRIKVGVTWGNTTSRYTPYWPWIFATIASLGNHHDELANYRLSNLLILVGALMEENWPYLHDFKAPTNLDNGKLWELPDFPRWQRIFGKVISF